MANKTLEGAHHSPLLLLLGIILVNPDFDLRHLIINHLLYTSIDRSILRNHITAMNASGNDLDRGLWSSLKWSTGLVVT